MAATKPEAERWPGPIVPFVIDANFDNPERILTAIRDHWEAQTNVRFIRRSHQDDFILFRHGQQCNSHVGFQGGMQAVTLVPDCGVAEIIHEIGHALGLIHEQQRSDRDSFVQVLQDHIESGKEHNFERIGHSFNLTDYDLRSIMHYGENAFSVNGSPTLVPTIANATLNSSPTFTSFDRNGINQLYPSVGIVRRSDSGFAAAGAVSEIVVAHSSVASEIITAVRTAAGTLRLIPWRINPFGGIVRGGQDSGDQAGQATSIAIARGRLFVTACQSAAGRLLLISWATAGGMIMRRKEITAGRADLIRLLALTDDLFVTACQASDGHLLLITWDLNGDTLIRGKDSGALAGKVTEISFVRVRQVGADHQVATTVRAEDGHILSIIWQIAGDGSITRGGNSSTQIGNGDLIESCIHPPTGLLVVSCRTANKNLKIITLAVSAGGGAVVRQQLDSGDQAGRIERNALMARSTGLLSAVKAANGNLKLIGWNITADGRVSRRGDSAPDQAGEIGFVRLADDTGQSAAPVLTCVQTGAGELKLITWDDQPDHGEIL